MSWLSLDMQASTPGTRAIHPHHAQAAVGRRSGADASTPLSQIPTPSPTAATPQESASTSMGPWLPRTPSTPPPLLELLQQGETPRTPGNEGQADPPPQDNKATQLVQLRELKAKLDEDRERHNQLEWALERDQPHPHRRGARGRARDVYRQIVGDEEPEQLISHFPRASQNIVAATMLLRNMLEPSNSQARCICDEVQGLLHVVAAQQAKSSASRRRGAATEKRFELARNEREVSVHQEPPPRGKKMVPIEERLVDNREPRDARNDINEH